MIYVTGGYGFIGSVVVKLLVREGQAVRCLVREGGRTDRIAGLPFEAVPGDVRDRESLRRGMAGCEAVIHLASLSSWDVIDSPAMNEVVEGGTRNVLWAAREAGVKKVVFVSSATAVNGSSEPRIFDETSAFSLSDPALRYCHAKRAAEAMCLEAARAGQHVVVVNPTEVYGPNDTGLVTSGTLIDFARSDPVLVCRGGTSIVYVEDVARGIVRAMDVGRSGERYILGGDNLDFRQLAELTLELLGQKKRVVVVPNAVFRGVTRIATGLRIPLPYNPKVVPYATRYWFMDSSKARRELGVTFRGARETLAPTLAWLKEAGHIGAAGEKKARAAQ